MTDDELIAAVSDRLDGGHFGYHGLMSKQQINYRDMWCALYLWVRQHPNPAVEAKMHELVDASPSFGVRAINTTEYGRE